MDVICIDAELTTNTLTEGKVYTVTSEYLYAGSPVYELAGLTGPYLKERFAPLSDLDETTLVNEEFNEKYCVPVNGKVCV